METQERDPPYIYIYIYERERERERERKLSYSSVGNMDCMRDNSLFIVKKMG